jgi:peptidylprolyl isomerase
MNQHHLAPLALALALAVPLAAQEPPAMPSPGEIVEQAPAADWRVIAPADLLVMDLAPDRDGIPRRVVIQLMPPPFSQGWIGNIRRLAAAQWWDGTSVYRVQDNYVVQWGDVNGDDPAKAKALPEGLGAVPEADYQAAIFSSLANALEVQGAAEEAQLVAAFRQDDGRQDEGAAAVRAMARALPRDAYADETITFAGWPLAVDRQARRAWPVHCYGMVGVARGMSPDTGSGTDLSTR